MSADEELHGEMFNYVTILVPCVSYFVCIAFALSSWCKGWICLNSRYFMSLGIQQRVSYSIGIIIMADDDLSLCEVNLVFWDTPVQWSGISLKRPADRFDLPPLVLLTFRRFESGRKETWKERQKE